LCTASELHEWIHVFCGIRLPNADPCRLGCSCIHQSCPTHIRCSNRDRPWSSQSTWQDALAAWSESSITMHALAQYLLHAERAMVLLPMHQENLIIFPIGFSQCTPQVLFSIGDKVISAAMILEVVVTRTTIMGTLILPSSSFQEVHNGMSTFTGPA